MGREDSSVSGSTAATAARLLQAASDVVGGDEQLAKRLNMSPILLRKFMAGRDELPPHILLQTVDLLLEARESGFPRHNPGRGAACNTEQP